MSIMGQIHSRFLTFPTSMNKPMKAEDQDGSKILCNQVFSNSVVTDSIFAHLQTSELLNCSLVSKTWNISAGTYLKNRRWLYFKIDLIGIPELKKTVKLLQKRALTANRPFRGLLFWVNIDDSHDSTYPKFRSAKAKSRAKDLLESIMKLIPVKHVVILYFFKSACAFISDILFPLFCEHEIETLAVGSRCNFELHDLLKNVYTNGGWNSLTTIRPWVKGDFYCQFSAKSCEITDCIFKNLRTSEIMDCSLVSKTWNITVRTYLQKRRWLYFKIRLISIPELKKTVKYLQNGTFTSNHPFRGLVFRVNIDKLSDSNPFQSARSQSRAKDLLEHIMKLLPLKHVAIMYSNDNMCAFISDVLFPLFLENQIETLSCGSFPHQPNDLFKQLEVKEWSSLKCVRPWKFGQTDCLLCPESCEALLRTCPNLQELTMFVEPKAISVFDKYSKLHVIRNLRVGGKDILNLEDIFTSEKASLFRLEQLIVSIYSQLDWMKQLNLLHGALQSSSNTLRRLRLKLYPPKYLSTYDSIFQINLPQLPFAKTVWIYSEESSKFSSHEKISKHPHLFKIFPNVNKISSGLGAKSYFVFGHMDFVLEATAFE